MLQSPLKIIKQLALSDRAVVADFGAGAGTHSVLFAKGFPNRVVYAVEIQKDFIPRIHRDLKEHNIKNVFPIWGDIEHPKGSKLGNGTIDYVFMAHVFSKVEDKQSCIREIVRILKPSGHVCIVDQSHTDKLYMKNTKSDNDPLAQTIRIFKQFGFSLQKELVVGTHEYGIILARQ